MAKVVVILLFRKVLFLSRSYRFVNNLSIDVSLGAVICALFFSNVLQADVRPAAFIALGITVWIIYTADHLLDAVKLKGPASTDRHRFHQRNFGVMVFFLLLAFTAVIVCIFYMRPLVLGAGILIGALVCVYLVINRKLGFMKESAGAVFYTTGIVMPAVILSHAQVTLPHALLILQFLVTAWINMLLFSLFDTENDEADNRISFSTVLGERHTVNLLKMLFALCTVFVAAQLVMHFARSVVILAVMDLVLFAIFACDKHFRINDRYRLAGDAVFLFPIFYLLA